MGRGAVRPCLLWFFALGSNLNLKILDFSRLFVADAPMKTKTKIDYTTSHRTFAMVDKISHGGEG